MSGNQLPDWAQAHFPSTAKEARKWEPLKYSYALHTNVLVVAITRIEGCWCAYCKNVPGEDHNEEIDEVLSWGNKLMESVARALFPRFGGVPYAN